MGFIFAQVARCRVLEEMRFLDDCYLLALDGTEYFSSSRVHCPHCLQKTLRSGERVYHHHLVDQTSQLCSSLFGAAWEKCGSKRALWEGVREIFHRFTVSSMREIYEALAHGHRKPLVEILRPP